MIEYVIGVDGGNTKTDYFLFTTDGHFVDAIRSGTCSHEALKDGYEGSYRTMNKEISTLLTNNNIQINNVVAACFGLAGVDVIEQKKSIRVRC